jgi:hypothetical protein
MGEACLEAIEAKKEDRGNPSRVPIPKLLHRAVQGYETATDSFFENSASAGIHTLLTWGELGALILCRASHPLEVVPQDLQPHPQSSPVQKRRDDAPGHKDPSP